MVKLNVGTKDPLKILTSTKVVLEKAKFLVMNPEKIPEISRIIKEKISNGLEGVEEHFGTTGNYQDDTQLIFIEDTVNFCFWSKKGKPKWQIEWPEEKIVKGGWYALQTCFKRALAEGESILNARYLSEFTIDDGRRLFRSPNQTEISLLKERVENLREAGQILLKKYNGQFVNVIKKSGNDAVKLVKLIYQQFPSFRDIFTLNGSKIFFLKRAQICVSDISLLTEEMFGKPLGNIEHLTAFADYKLPQILRMFGVISYSKSLAQKIDNYLLIPSGSLEEVEIRAATIWAVELIRQKLVKYPASKIDFALWLLSQEVMEKAKPHHRTYSIHY